MAPIKFEENIKDKLEKRTLSPTSESWSKLSDRLDEDEKKSKKPMYWWLSIAAGLLILMAISIPFFNNNDSEVIQPRMVEEEAIKKHIQKETIQPEQKESIELANEAHEVEDKSQEAKTSKLIDYKKAGKLNSETKTQLAENREVLENPTAITTNKNVNQELQTEIDETIIKNAIAEAMETLKSENNSVTEQEIDSLLKLASKELFREKLQKETSKTVDATQLLESVEDEMGQSFRTKVFEALKDSYESVKTAVADRNN